MAGVDVIEAAIGITLLLIVSYVVIGSITTAAVTVTSAQNDITQSQLDRIGTSIMIADYHYHGPFSVTYYIDFRVKNTGNQVINDPDKMDLMVIRGSNPPLLYKYGSGSSGSNSWYYDGNYDIDITQGAEIINPGQWDPGEMMYVHYEVDYQPNSSSDYIQFVLPNGAKTMNINPIYWLSGG
jgi:archaellum component FlaG (FlaF/FlaG flagellin family)